MAVAIRRLLQADSAEAFDCGDEPLNNYLRRHAWANQEKSLIGVTYVALEDSVPGVILGYFTLATSSIPRDRLPKKQVRGLPPYDLPLILLARLAVDLRFTGKGLGAALLAEALRVSLAVSEEVGCRYVITDAYRDKAAWYQRFGFIPLDGAPEGGTVKMFLDLRTVRAAHSSR